MLSDYVQKKWYSDSPGLLYLLWPLMWLYSKIIKRRRLHLLKTNPDTFPIPIVVIGNLSVGGTGKTPLLIHLVKALKKNNIEVGVVSKGYGRKRNVNYIVDGNSTAVEVGDEPLLIYQETKALVAVGQSRTESIQTLVKKNVHVIFTDDGMQDYAFKHDLEIVVIDGKRGFGNGYLLPLGPLRESISRLKESHYAVVNALKATGRIELGLPIPSENIFKANVVPVGIRNVKTLQVIDLKEIKKLGVITAVAGIGNPNKFFDTLDEMGATYTRMAFPDHHDFLENEFKNISSEHIIMTSKDAVKCRHFANDRMWELQIGMEVSDKLVTAILGEIGYIKSE